MEVLVTKDKLAEDQRTLIFAEVDEACDDITPEEKRDHYTSDAMVFLENLISQMFHLLPLVCLHTEF